MDFPGIDDIQGASWDDLVDLEARVKDSIGQRQIEQDENTSGKRKSQWDKEDRKHQERIKQEKGLLGDIEKELNDREQNNDHDQDQSEVE